MMKNKLSADIVIVGGGTAGSYTAWRLAQKGHSVIVVEQKKRKTPGRNIGIFHMDEIRFARFDIPLPQGEELIGYYPDGFAWPPDGNDAKRVRYAFYVMELPLFIERLQGYAVKAGADILFETRLAAPIVTDGAVRGIRVRRGGRNIDIDARIVIDASGAGSAVRTALPAGIGIETDPIVPSDYLYVILQYWDRIAGRDTGAFPRGLNFYPFHKAFINPSYGDGAIVGIGQPGSLGEAERIQREFLDERFPGIRHRLVRKTWGKTPYRRPPLSIVTDGLMIVGDAAFMTKPFSGEGVTSGFTACDIAVDTAHNALEKGGTGRASLWPLNVRYFRGQGAKFAALLAQLPAAAELSRSDVNYLFQENVIFSSYDFESMNRDFEVRLGPGRLLNVAAKLVKGRISGRLSREGFKALLAAMSIAGKIRAHYESYPDDPERFEQWARGARTLWGEQ